MLSSRLVGLVNDLSDDARAHLLGGLALHAMPPAKTSVRAGSRALTPLRRTALPAHLCLEPEEVLVVSLVPSARQTAGLGEEAARRSRRSAVPQGQRTAARPPVLCSVALP